MSDNKKMVESHGCIVCGKVYNMLVIYSPDGKLVDCTVTDAGGHRVPDLLRPLVACDKHTSSQIETALSRHYPGMELPEGKDDEI